MVKAVLALLLRTLLGCKIQHTFLRQAVLTCNALLRDNVCPLPRAMQDPI